MIPAILIISDPLNLALEIINNLINKNIFVVISSKQNKSWQESLKYNNNTFYKILTNLEEVSEFAENRNLEINYALIINESVTAKNLNEIEKLSDLQKVKPKISFILNKNNKEVDGLLNKLTRNRKLNFNVINIIYSESSSEKLPTNNVANKIVRNFFGYWEKNITLNLTALDSKIFENSLLNKPKKIRGFKLMKIDLYKLKFPKVTLNKKPFLVFVCLIFIYLLLPFATLLLGMFFIRSSYNGLLNESFAKSKQKLIIAEHLSFYSNSLFNTLLEIPIVGIKFQQFSSLSFTLVRIAKIGETGLDLADQATSMVQNVVNKNDIDLLRVSNKLKLDLDFIYKETSFLQADVDKIPLFFFRNEIAPVIGGDNVIKQKINFLSSLEKVRFYLAQAQLFVTRLPELLGETSPKTYMILFQNNTEIRPTGGFIGSFALVKFDKGRLTEFPVYDVYSADGQLKGHVEPPDPIKKYLGEANWYLRDSNWDPDFSVSSQRAEWFLNKEIDVSVDGVIGVDLEFFKSILTNIGSVRIADFNSQVDHNNMYQVIEAEVESDFFPGSRKKSNFLSSLAGSVLERMTDIKKEAYLSLVKSIIGDLKGRHLQIFLHDNKASNVISDFNWDGKINFSVCRPNCFNNWIGVVDANVGVNKVNSFVKREMSLVVSVDKDYITNNLKISLTNKYNGTSEMAYKDYLRVMVPGGSIFEDIEILNNNNVLAVTPEIQEIGGRIDAGTLISIAKGQTYEITYRWKIPVNLDFSKRGNINFNWRKQAGTMSDNVIGKINFPQGLVFVGQSVYNTFLSEDLSIKYTW